MKNNDILNIALSQSAIDLNCNPEDSLSVENKVVLSEANPLARKYLELPFACNLMSYGNNIVASVQEEYAGFVEHTSINTRLSTALRHPTCMF